MCLQPHRQVIAGDGEGERRRRGRRGLQWLASGQVLAGRRGERGREEILLQENKKSRNQTDQFVS